MTLQFIPVSEPYLDETDAALVAEAVGTGWISSEGKFIREFEESWADYCGVKYGVAVSNGTTALQVALRAIELEPGSEVIMPSFTIISCALAVVEAGCIPVLVDAEPDTWCMDMNQVEAKITSRTRAIMPVHMFGHPVDMRRVSEIAQKHNLIVIEDAAEAHGAEVDGRRSGGLSDLACFSFYANKIVTTGEGGMIVTNNQHYAERCRSLRNLCFLPEQRFLHRELGHNYRMTNVAAAIGVAQTRRVEKHIAHKRWMAERYTAALRGLNQISLPVERPWAKNVYWMYGVVLGDEVPFDARECAKRLQERGIGTRPFFWGMHEQPVFHDRGLFLGEYYPVTEKLARRGFYLPSGLRITADEIDRSCDALKDVLA